MTAIVAVYAALVATAALAWNVYTWCQSRRTRIALRSYERPYYGPDHEQAGWAFYVLVTNQSGHVVSVTDVAVKDESSDRYWPLHMVTSSRDQLPVAVPQYHQVELGCDAIDLESVDDSTMTIRVRLGDDSYHYLPPQRSIATRPKLWPFRRP